MSKQVTPESIQRSVSSFNRNTKIDFSRYRYLVTTLGPGYSSIVCFYQAIKPEQVLLIVSPETEMYVDDLFELFKIYHPIKFTDLKWHSCGSTDMPAIYKYILDFCSDKPVQHVLFDATAGKKTMTSAAAMAASFLNADLAYGDFEYDFNKNKIIEGTEVGVLIENPYSVYGDLEKQNAKDRMLRGDFDGAVRILINLEERVSDIGSIRNMRIIAEVLQQWNLFFYNGAKEKLLKFNSKQFDTQTTYDKLVETITALADEKHQEHYTSELANFFFAAKRYANNGKYDLGVLLMFRVIERYAQLRLKELGIKADSIGPGVFTDDVYTRFCGFKKELYGPKTRIDKNPPYKVSCLEAYILLHALEHKAFSGENAVSFIKEIKELCEVRNKSIYTHGTTPLSEEIYATFESFARKLLSLYLKEKSKISFNNFQSLLLHEWIADL